MRIAKIVFVIGFLASMSLVAGAQKKVAKERSPASAPGEIHVAIVTEVGTIEVALDPQHAPGTVANFLRYMDAGYYDGGRFHRTVKLNPDNQPNNTVKIEVIQAGPRIDEAIPPPDRKDPFPPIPIERTNKTSILHKDGVISMARLGPDTATADFFICVGDQPELDFGGKRNPDGQGFAAFGHVVKGMDVVRRIHQSPVKEQRLTPPILIQFIRRMPGS